LKKEKFPPVRKKADRKSPFAESQKEKINIKRCPIAEGER